MSKFSESDIERWIDLSDEWLKVRGFKREDIKAGADAWAVFHAAINPVVYAYKDRAVTDAHIKTALSKVFPNAVFQDKYFY